MTTKNSFRAIRTGLIAGTVLSLGMSAFAPAFVAAKPPDHAPAHGWRSKQQGQKHGKKVKSAREGDRDGRGSDWERRRDDDRRGDDDRWRDEARRRDEDRRRDENRDRERRLYRNRDLDRDGIKDARDRDMDGDGVSNTRDRYPRDARRR